VVIAHAIFLVEIGIWADFYAWLGASAIIEVEHVRVGTFSQLESTLPGIDGLETITASRVLSLPLFAIIYRTLTCASLIIPGAPVRTPPCFFADTFCGLFDDFDDLRLFAIVLYCVNINLIILRVIHSRDIFRVFGIFDFFSFLGFF